MASEMESVPAKWLQHFKLYSLNPELIAAWKHVFTNSRYTGIVEIENTNINKVDLPTNSALIIPGNSFGFLSEQTCELHSRAVKLFGSNLQEKITSIITTKHNGELLVGESTLLSLPTDTHYILYTPTCRVDTAKENRMNIFLSVRAALKRVRKHNNGESAIQINTLICNGIREEHVPPIRIAVQMKVALDAILFNKCAIFQSPENLAHPISLDVALSKLKEQSELETNRYLINCML